MSRARRVLAARIARAACASSRRVAASVPAAPPLERPEPVVSCAWCDLDRPLSLMTPVALGGAPVPACSAVCVASLEAAGDVAGLAGAVAGAVQALAGRAGLSEASPFRGAFAGAVSDAGSVAELASPDDPAASFVVVLSSGVAVRVLVSVPSAEP